MRATGDMYIPFALIYVKVGMLAGDVRRYGLYLLRYYTTCHVTGERESGSSVRDSDCL